MSLPLTRRIARTALLVAAGAAPVVGAADAASAADLALPQASKLGGLSALDTAVVGSLADSASHHVGSAAGEVGGKAGGTVTRALKGPEQTAPVTRTAEKAAPAAGKTVSGAKSASGKAGKAGAAKAGAVKAGAVKAGKGDHGKAEAGKGQGKGKARHAAPSRGKAAMSKVGKAVTGKVGKASKAGKGAAGKAHEAGQATPAAPAAPSTLPGNSLTDGLSVKGLPILGS